MEKFPVQLCAVSDLCKRGTELTRFDMSHGCDYEDCCLLRKRVKKRESKSFRNDGR
jgi:hypothetical protein